MKQNGLAEIRSKSRKDSINMIIKLLAELPIEQLKVAIQSLSKYSRADHSLQGWADVILDREPEKGE